MLLIDTTGLERRRAAAAEGGPLAPLFDSLAAELEPLLAGEPYIPATKALLSRAGGRCEIDGAQLEFDPASPYKHRCPVCGVLHRGELHHRAWITSYQLWLAERAVHAALFHLLRGAERHASLARDILQAYADRYLGYPNRDNVLGPTRLFFSTYLESIWLLQICIAADLLRACGDDATAALVCDRIVEPSSSLIAEYGEGMSNRQVWNNAALMAAASLRADRRAFDERVHGDFGLHTHLATGLLPDGTWYEGDNYHQFAVRGLWYGVVALDVAGGHLDGSLEERFGRAFAAPFASALPDFTLPSRKDSQYATSLRQWRFAELAELGFARTRSPELLDALARCYADGPEHRPTGRATSTADVERNGPPGTLTRADLGWRALLHAVPVLPPAAQASPRSMHLEGQGLAIFRRDGDVYVALDYGQSGGGHGHPDRLNLVLMQGGTRWLDDLGTGSYVDPSLHWYRSSLAHNAPFVNGRSQTIRDGHLVAHDEREGLGWVRARLPADRDGVEFVRTIVVAPTYLVDDLEWHATADARIDLPMHLDGTVPGVEFVPATLAGGESPEDGFGFVRDVAAAQFDAHVPLTLSAERDGRCLHARVVCTHPMIVFAARAPGQPPSALRRFFLLRVERADRTGTGRGTIRAILSWSALTDCRFDASTLTVRDADEVHVHRKLDGDRWRVELSVGDARSSIDLAGGRPRVELGGAASGLPARRPPLVLRRAQLPERWLADMTEAQRTQLLTFELSEMHYRRSEEPWHAAGSPLATVAMAQDGATLRVLALVRAGERHFAAADGENPFDNEPADTMRAGIQLYVRAPHGSGAWMLVPGEQPEAVRVRPITGWGSLVAPRAQWRPQGEGYEMRVDVPLPLLATEVPHLGEVPVDVDVIINESTRERDRRRGQLVMSGARGEFVYLRGDRHDPARLVPLVLVP